MRFASAEWCPEWAASKWAIESEWGTWLQTSNQLRQWPFLVNSGPFTSAVHALLKTSDWDLSSFGVEWVKGHLHCHVESEDECTLWQPSYSMMFAAMHQLINLVWAEICNAIRGWQMLCSYCDGKFQAVIFERISSYLWWRKSRLCWTILWGMNWLDCLEHCWILKERIAINRQKIW